MVQLPTIDHGLEANFKPLRRVSFAHDGDDLSHGKHDKCLSKTDGCSPTSIRVLCGCSPAAASTSAAASAVSGPSANNNSPVFKLLRLGYAADKGRRHSMEDSHVMIECLEGSLPDVATPVQAAAVPTTCLLAVSATLAAPLKLDCLTDCQHLCFPVNHVFEHACIEGMHVPSAAQLLRLTWRGACL
jgi:hypothetical protein